MHSSGSHRTMAIPLALLLVAIMYLPTVPALQPLPPTFTPTRTPVRGPLNWWETTSMDADGDHIFDLLAPRIERHGCWPVYVDYGRPINDRDRAVVAAMSDVTSFLECFNAIGTGPVDMATARALAALDGVVMVEPAGIPVLYGDVQSRNIKARDSDIYSPNTAWELGYRGEGVSIAIVDTGVDSEHPSLKGKWLGGADISKPETFLTPRDGSYDADDTNGHGTSCTGMAMGTGAPEGTYMGAAPDARLVEVRIGTMIGYAPGELLQKNYDASLKGIEWAIDHREDNWAGAPEEYSGIDIISLSWGIDVGGSTDGSDIYSRSLNTAMKAGIVVVNAAGNSGPDNTGFDGFAASDLSITIAATDDGNTVDRSDDIIAPYSSRGPRKDDTDSDPYDILIPDVAASGTNIIQCQYDRFGDASDNGYQNRGSGTSYATPSVAGVVALILQANPDLDGAMVKDILHHTAQRSGDATMPELDPFWNRDFGYGIVDAYRAVELARKTIDPDVIDTRLQCYITNISSTENITGPIDISGIAWGRGTSIEEVFYRVDGGKWTQLTLNTKMVWPGFGIHLQPGGRGEHTVEVMASSNGLHSLIDSITYTVTKEYHATSSDISSPTTAVMIVVAFLALGAVGAAVVVAYIRKRRGS